MRKRTFITTVLIVMATITGPATTVTATDAPIAAPVPQPAPPADPAFEPFVDPGEIFAPAAGPPSKGIKTTTTGTPAPFEDAPELMLFKDLPVIVAAGKREQTQQQAAASVSVITADEIQIFGYRNLADILRGQRSFYLHTDGLNWFGGVRGFLRPGEWNARMLVLVDGRPTREQIYGQTHIDQDFVIPIEAMKRVEVVRGPGSALYGSNAVFSVVNVVTKDGADVNGLQLKIDGGNKETGRVSALYGTKTSDGWDVLSGFAAYTSQGDKDIIFDGVHDADHNFGHIRGSDYEGADSGFLKVRKGDFTAQFDMESRQRDNRSATYLASFSNPGSQHEERANVTLRLDHEVAAGQSLHVMAYYSHYLYRQAYGFAPDPVAGTPAYRYVTQGQDDWVGAEFHYNWQINRQIHLTTGAEGTATLFSRQKDYDDIHGVVLDIPSSFNSWGIFAEAEWKTTDWLTLVGGLRLDSVQRIGLQLNPRFAAIVTPSKEDAIKALYGRAFRAEPV